MNKYRPKGKSNKPSKKIVTRMDNSLDRELEGDNELSGKPLKTFNPSRSNMVYNEGGLSDIESA